MCEGEDPSTTDREFPAMNDVYARFFDADFPARSTIQVAALPKGASVVSQKRVHAR